MKKLLCNSERFEYHASPRMVPHLFKPEVKYVKLTIEKYIPCLKKIKVSVKGTSPILRKMSEEDGQLIARYFGACKEDVWRPSLVAFPRFQLSPSIVHKVPHSFRTTDMLTDAMQQLQDTSYRTKCESPWQEPADVAAVKDQACEDKEPMIQERDGVFTEVVCNQNVSVPGSPVKAFPIHTFFCGDYVTVGTRGIVSITFVPVLPQTSSFHKDRNNAYWCHSVHKMDTPYQPAADISRPAVDSGNPAYVTDSDKHTFKNCVSNVDSHSPEFAGQCDDADDNVLATPPSKILTSPKEKWGTPCDAKLGSTTFSGQEDMELSPRLTHYMEEGIVPESPVVHVSHLQVETDRTVSIGFVPEFGSLKIDERAHANPSGCRKGPLRFEKNDQRLCDVTELGSLRQNVLDQTVAKTGVPACPSNVKICTPTTPTTDLLCDSFSNDCQLRSGGDTSGSVQQAPKYRRLCKYGDKIKRVSSISLDDYHDGFGECDISTKTMPNQTEHDVGKKGKAKRRFDTYIDEEVEVSEDANVSEDEDDDQSEDKYEDSFIDDLATPTGEFTQTEQGGENNGDMMGFYRRSLLTQSPVVLPSRYLDVSDNSASRSGNMSCSSENLHNSTETPKGPAQTHGTIDPSPSWYRQASLGRASLEKEQSETAIVNCESSTKLDCRKRKLSFQQPASIPVINLESEPAPQPSSHLATAVDDDIYLDDAFFEGLDLDAIEAEATKMWREKNAQSTQKPVETKKASEISFAPPSFDLGF